MEELKRFLNGRVVVKVGDITKEDVDAIGLSCLSGAHMHLFQRVMELLRERGVDDIVVFGGGTIPDEDIPKLKAAGMAAVFTPGATTGEAIEFVKTRVAR